VVAVAALLVALARPAQAITYGVPDGSAHLNAGALVFVDEDGLFTVNTDGDPAGLHAGGSQLTPDERL
jgi:hypothetical protein